MSVHYVGKAGQFAVMAELAWRGYNVSIPEIDVGDDVFVLNDATGELSRVQVKTATGKRLRRTKNAFRCQFTIDVRHVSGHRGTHYVLAGRCGATWRFLVMERSVLARLIKRGLGTSFGEHRRMVTVVFFSRLDARTSTLRTARDLSRHAHRWDLWKRLPSGSASN